MEDVKPDMEVDVHTEISEPPAKRRCADSSSLRGRGATDYEQGYSSEFDCGLDMEDQGYPFGASRGALSPDWDGILKCWHCGCVILDFNDE